MSLAHAPSPWGSRCRIVVCLATPWLALLLVAACSDEPTQPDPVPPTPIQQLTTVVVTPPTATLAFPGGTRQFQAEVRDENGNPIVGAPVQWSSTDTAVATVDATGFATAVSLGNAEISARHGNIEGHGRILAIRDPERSALIAFHNATGGANWAENTNWLSGSPLSDWHGVETNADGRVLRLVLEANGLTGGIPTEIGDLPYLQRLDLDENALSGPIPPSIGNLKRLEHLTVADNDLGGPIPPEFSGATGLFLLVLDGNPLEGLLPHNMTRLHPYQLQYQHTRLCAPRSAVFTTWLDNIGLLRPEYCSPARHDGLVLAELYHALGGPEWTRRDGWLSDRPLGQWAGVTVDAGGRVTSLNLANNAVAGDLPPSLSYLDALTRLDLRGNTGLTGTLPEWITELSLDAFHVADTGLCVPPGEGFGAWLTDMDESSGDKCAGADAILTSMPVVYLTQSAQNRSGGVPLIAGRDALLRVFTVADATNYFDSEVRAAFYLDGDEVHAVTITAGGRRGIGLEVDEGRFEGSHNAVIPGDVLVPGLEMVMEFDPDDRLALKAGSQRRIPESGALALDIRELPVMDLTIVPIRIAGDSDTAQAVAASKLTLHSPQLKEFRTIIPVGEIDFAVREALTVSAQTWEASGLAVLEMLRQADGASGYYAGIHGLSGIAALGGRVSISQLDGSIIAHEIAHNLNLRHAPCGNPADVDSDYPYPAGRTGVWGYDSETRELKDPVLPDIMSYCREPEWISDYNFTKALEYRFSAERASAIGHASRHRLTVTTEQSPTRTIFLWGRVGPDEVTLEPAVVLDAVPSLPDVEGPYRIVGRSAGGGTLFSLDFAPMIEAESGEGMFVFALPVEVYWVGALASITLSGPGGSDTLDGATRRPLAIVRDRVTGRIRSVLQGFEAIPEASTGDEVTVSHGLPGGVSPP